MRFESQLSHERPDVFLQVQLRALCRQWDERDVGRLNARIFLSKLAPFGTPRRNILLRHKL